MIYLENHKEKIKKELELFANRIFTDKKVVYEFMHSEFPTKICEEIATNIEDVFRSSILEFVLQYAEEKDLTFAQLKNFMRSK